tara:strand:- start:5160 stop:5348 length:189 start_codon:yes stop_codon:yes gene_type:complete
MSTITIDGIEHDTESFNKDQQALHHAINFCDVKLVELDNEKAALQTARQAYVNDLGNSLKDD